MEIIVMNIAAPVAEVSALELMIQAVTDFDQSKIASLQAKAIVNPKVKTIIARTCFLNSSLYLNPTKV